MRARSVALVALVLAVVPAAPASAHPELRRTDPAAGAVLAQPPRELRVAVTERLDPAGRARVTDGCGRTLPATTSVEGEQVVVGVGPGAPGPWQVSLDLVSAEDGHPVQTSYGFTVQGAGPCEGSPVAVEPGRPAPAAPPAGSPGSPLPLVLLVLGGGGLVAVALLVRRRAGG